MAPGHSLPECSWCARFSAGTGAAPLTARSPAPRASCSCSFSTFCAVRELERMFAVVGLSHHTAPIEIREQLALEREQIEALLKQLLAQPQISEALVLSTCNRVEVMACAAVGIDNDSLDQAIRA